MILPTCRKRLPAAALLLAVLLLAVLLLGPLTAAAEPPLLPQLEGNFRAAMLRGWRTFQGSLAADGVACVDCHSNHQALRRWASAYPKVEVFDGTDYRVKTLSRVVGEALEKHSDLGPAVRATLVEDLVAYLAWWADGEVVAPGRSRQLPPAQQDLALLEMAAAEGEARFRIRCGSCHSSASLRGAATRFPCYVEQVGRVMSLPTYLSRHQRRKNVAGEGGDEAVTALAAYLARLASGQVYRPGRPLREGREGE